MVQLILKNGLLGMGLAMDACAVSMANGLKQTNMKLIKICLISFIFALFQGLMPLIGYFIGSVTLTKISWIIPFLALSLLSIIGIRMIIEGKRNNEDEEISIVNTKLVLAQAFATSIDALTVGFTIANYTLIEALFSIAIIFIVTYIICFIGILIGKKFGTNLGGKAQILGGVILLVIGVEIFIKGLFF